MAETLHVTVRRKKTLFTHPAPTYSAQRPAVRKNSTMPQVSTKRLTKRLAPAKPAHDPHSPVVHQRRASCTAVSVAKPSVASAPGTEGFIGAGGSLPNLPPALREQLLSEQATMAASAAKEAAMKKKINSLGEDKKSSSRRR